MCTVSWWPKVNATDRSVSVYSNTRRTFHKKGLFLKTNKLARYSKDLTRSVCINTGAPILIWVCQPNEYMWLVNRCLAVKKRYSDICVHYRNGELLHRDNVLSAGCHTTCIHKAKGVKIYIWRKILMPNNNEKVQKFTRVQTEHSWVI